MLAKFFLMCDTVDWAIKLIVYFLDLIPNNHSIPFALVQLQNTCFDVRRFLRDAWFSG